MTSFPLINADHRRSKKLGRRIVHDRGLALVQALAHSSASMRVSTSIPRMYADDRGFRHSELTESLIGIFFNIYNELGHGFLESVYEEAFSVALAEASIFFQRQMAVPVWFRGRRIGDFRADLLVDGKVIVELKTGREIDPAWEKQLLNYLRATDIEVGLLFNFGPAAQFRRYAFANERKGNPRDQRLSAEMKLR